jgi:hypothetical protein
VMLILQRLPRRPRDRHLARTRRQRLLAAGVVVSVPGVLGVFNELKVESDVRHVVGRSASIRSSDEA